MIHPDDLETTLRVLGMLHTIPEDDPDHVAVTTRYVQATRRPRGDGQPEVGDPLLPALALAWAVRDLATHLAGRVPSTWSRTIAIGHAGGLPDVAVWTRHPGCGCCWTADARPSGTMEA